MGEDSKRKRVRMKWKILGPRKIGHVWCKKCQESSLHHIIWTKIINLYGCKIEM